MHAGIDDGEEQAEPLSNGAGILTLLGTRWNKMFFLHCAIKLFHLAEK